MLSERTAQSRCLGSSLQSVWFVPCEVKHNIYVMLPLVIVAVALPSESSDYTKGCPEKGQERGKYCSYSNNLDGVLGLMGLKVTQVKNIIIICERGCQQCNYQALSERKCFISLLKTLPLSCPSTHHTAAHDSVYGIVGCLQQIPKQNFLSVKNKIAAYLEINGAMRAL
uniref:Uncharacterized protein n=1 Tax=Glossina pallidipes TaxID=7398 RepID=A0A1B0AG44_GLOPL